MIITWMGHSCFKLKSDNGTILITDPFNEEVGYPLPNGRADIITVSHAHKDHNNTQVIGGNPIVIDTPGISKVAGLSILGILTNHDEHNGKQRGKNIIFVIEMDALRICHMGDLGETLTQDQVSNLGRIDVLLIPVGGYYTIDATIAAKITSMIEPNIIIPMHYKLDFVRYNIEGVASYVNIMKGCADISTLGSNSLVINPAKAKKRQRVVVMNYQP